MKQWCSFLLMTFFSVVNVYAQGINFEQGTWAEVVEKAKKANKLIYMDVYATWCGPCKMMARDVFPHPDAGAKYNELFINYKIDAEKGEGRTIAAKYAVSSYPTNLYIDPKTEDVVYRVAGACDVPEFLRRADIAQLDYTDPMTWADYNSQLKKSPKDLAFLQKYIEKAGRTGNYADNAIDIYVQHHLQKPITDSNLIFLINYTSTFDNQGYKVLMQHKDRANAIIKDPRYSIEEREKNYWLQNTYKKALALKDIKVLASIKPTLYKFNQQDSLGAWYNVEKQFYQAIKDESAMIGSITNAAKYYYKQSKKDIQARDKAMLQDNVNRLRQELQSKNTPEQSIEAQVQQQSSNPQFANAFSNNATNVLNTAAVELYARAETSTKSLQEAVKWMEKAMDLNEIGTVNWMKSLENLVNIHLKLGQKAKAIKVLEGYKAQFQKENRDITGLQSLLNKMQ